jgi:site-specific recombinase XerD
MHPDWALLVDSWRLALESDGYSRHTRRTYKAAVDSLAVWMAEHAPGVGPTELERAHVRGWLASVRAARSVATARSWIAGVRHFARFLVDEGEMSSDPTEGVKTPPPADPRGRVLTEAECKRLVAACEGSRFEDRRDAAIVLLFLDGGLRLGELGGLQLDDVDLVDRTVFVLGKGSARSGPRRRMVPLGTKAARALDRYIRARRRHPAADVGGLWLGQRGQPGLSLDGIDLVVKRRAKVAGLRGVHPHLLRHTWAHHFRAAGGSEGDLMVLGGWRNRAMLDRYGRGGAESRAAGAARRYSLGDRL